MPEKGGLSWRQGNLVFLALAVSTRRLLGLMLTTGRICPLILSTTRRRSHGFTTRSQTERLARAAVRTGLVRQATVQTAKNRSTADPLCDYTSRGVFYVAKTRKRPQKRKKNGATPPVDNLWILLNLLTKNHLLFKLTKENLIHFSKISMKLNSKTLQKNILELEVEIPVEELKNFLDKAAAALALEVKIDGFRPEKVPFDILAKHVGEMTIYEKAAELAVEKTYPKIIKDEHLETLGSPEISIVKLAPGNPLIFKAKVSLVPTVKLGDYQKIKIPRKKAELEEKKVEAALHDLQRMQTKEVLAARPAGKADKLVIDMDMFLDKAPLEGGQTKNHAIYMAEAYYVPGLTEQLIGLSAGDCKEFTLSFPKEHYQKNLAGKNVDFKIKVTSVFELQPPAQDDAFAKALGQATFDDLENLVRKNLLVEMENQEEARLEEEILKQLVANSRFDDIPETLINSEAHKMVHELEDSLAERGINFDDYLKNLKKTEGQLMLDFAPRAVERIKTALAIKELSAAEKIEATEAEIEEEITKLAEAYKKEPDILEHVRSEESKQYLSNVIKNRKAVILLKNLATK